MDSFKPSFQRTMVWFNFFSFQLVLCEWALAFKYGFWFKENFDCLASSSVGLWLRFIQTSVFDLILLQLDIFDVIMIIWPVCNVQCVPFDVLCLVGFSFLLILIKTKTFCFGQIFFRCNLCPFFYPLISISLNWPGCQHSWIWLWKITSKFDRLTKNWFSPKSDQLRSIGQCFFPNE